MFAFGMCVLQGGLSVAGNVLCHGLPDDHQLIPSCRRSGGELLAFHVP